MRFRNREHAGELLAERLADYKGQDVVVLALPRGGLPLGRIVADALGAPLDAMVARKMGAPGNEEFALGAVTARGHRVLNQQALRHLFVPPGYLEAKTEEQRKVAEQREADLRGLRPPVPLMGRVAILVDDGIATGMTMRAAIVDTRAQDPKAVVVAVPVIAPDTYYDLVQLVDDVVTLAVPPDFYAVGQFYDDFTQVEDEDVRALLSGGAPTGRS